MKKQFVKLVEAAAADPMKDVYLDLIQGGVRSIGEYVATVYAMETQIQVIRFTLDGDEYRDKVMELDRRRRNAHEAAIAAVCFINRAAERLGQPLFFDGNSEDRHAVGDFCGEFVKEVFDGRTSNMDITGLLA